MEENWGVRTEDQGSGFDSSKGYSNERVVKEKEAKPRLVPPPGDGKRIYEIDPMLRSYSDHLDYR